MLLKLLAESTAWSRRFWKEKTQRCFLLCRGKLTPFLNPWIDGTIGEVI